MITGAPVAHYVRADRAASQGRPTMESAMEDDMCYAARFPGMPGYGAICADEPQYSKATSKDIADWILRGAYIERVTTAVAVEGARVYSAAKRFPTRAGLAIAQLHRGVR